MLLFAHLLLVVLAELCWALEGVLSHTSLKRGADVTTEGPNPERSF